MKIALGNDHAGFPLKAFVQSVLEDLGHEVIDCGAPSEAPVDFPDITRATCDLVRTGEAERAVLVCGTGVGAVMAANKIPGIRCALGHDVYSAHQSVEHDDANAIAMGAWLIGRATAKEVLAVIPRRQIRQRRGHHPAGPEAARNGARRGQGTGRRNLTRPACKQNSTGLRHTDQAIQQYQRRYRT